MSKKSLLGIIAVTAMAVFIFSALPSFAQNIPTPYCTTTGNYQLCTDRDDYSPEMTVHITGSGFASDSNYLIKVTRPDGSVVSGDGYFGSWYAAYDIVVPDSNGNFQYDYVLDGITGEYKIEVLDFGNNVLASHTFTDSTISCSPNPATVSTSVTCTASGTGGAGSDRIDWFYPSSSASSTFSDTCSSGGSCVSTRSPGSTGSWTVKLIKISDGSTRASTTLTVNLATLCSNGIVEGTEQCDGGACCNADCTFKSSSNVCRASAGVCDVAETCTGLSATCPTDQFQSSGTSCDDGLFCNVGETCNGAGQCTGGSARSCSANNIFGIETCDNNPDNYHPTWDYRAAFTSTCDESNDICPTGSETIAHICNKATCGAECDGTGTECQPKIVSDYCYYVGSCNTDPTACSCDYGNNQYCPAPGTVTDGTCYYGTQSCSESGCEISSALMNHYDTCDPVSGPIDTIPPTIDSHSDVTAEATGPTGAIVSYTSPATHDAVDGDGIATCLPASGSTFALGDTTVTCNAQDVAGNHATPTNFKVTVVDTTPPVVTVPADITEEATGPSGNVVIFTATASDIVDGSITPTCIPASGSTFPITITEVTCSATDAHGNTGSSSFDVIVQDTTPPVISGAPTSANSNGWYKNDVTVHFTCTDSGSGVDSLTPDTTLSVEGSGQHVLGTCVDKSGNSATFDVTGINIDKTNPVSTLTIGTPKLGTGPIYVSLTTSFELSAEDQVGLSGVDYREYKFDSGSWTNYAGAFTAPSLGSHTLYYRSADNAGNVEDAQSVNINVGATSLKLLKVPITSGTTPGQYSDPATVSAKLTDLATELPISGKSISFTIGTQTATANTDESGVASTTITLTQPSGSYTVSASFSGDVNYQSSIDSKSFTINKENVAIEYTGDTSVLTAGPTITTAPVRLSAKLTQENDGYPGDLTKAKVAFELTGTGSPITVANIPVSAVGDALTTINVPVGDYFVKVTISVGNLYWTQSPYGGGTLHVEVGSNDQRVTGGGWIADAQSVNGKDNFGFTVNYNKNGAPKGNFLFMFRGTDGYNYQLKSNSWAKGGLSFTGTNTAFFTAKATLSKIDSVTGAVVSSDGSYTFVVNIQDLDLNVKPVKTPDTFSITIFDSSNNIWKQVGTSASQITLGGGNIVVHSK